MPTWGTGNAGASNSHYLESHSIAYRTVMADLPTDGTVVELVIGYNVKRSGQYAIDYLTHYQRLLPHVLFGHTQPESFDPLAGVVRLENPVLPASLEKITLRGLTLGNGRIDIEVRRDGDAVAMSVPRRSGDIRAALVA